MPACCRLQSCLPRPALPAAAQEMAPHRAVYSVVTAGAWQAGRRRARHLRLRTQADLRRLRHQPAPAARDSRAARHGGERAAVADDREPRRPKLQLRASHRRPNGKQTSLMKGDALLDDDGSGQAHFSEPEGQTVALPVGTLFPIAIARAHDPPRQGGRRRLRRAVLLRREGQAAAVGQHRDRQGAQAPGRREDPRGRRAARRRPLRGSTTAPASSKPIPRARSRRRANPPSR